MKERMSLILYGATQAYRNLRGVVKNHKNPIPDTFLLLQGKIVCENFSFDFCYPNNSSLNWNSNINLIMTPLRHILWRLISNDLQGFTLDHFLHSFSTRVWLSLTPITPPPPPTLTTTTIWEKKRPCSVCLKMITMCLGLSFNLNFVLFYF